MGSGDQYQVGNVGPGAIVIQGSNNKIRMPARAQPPRQLPRDVGQFTGREDELAWLSAHSQPVLDGEGGLVLAITGMPGAGKSALALYFAHRLARQGFGDVQLYAILREPDNRPKDPVVILKNFLMALGVKKPQGDESVLSARFRSELADRRSVVILDDALSSAQVRPLLPGGRHCLTLVTSRRRLSGLEGAGHLGLTELPPQPAEELIRKIAGEDVAAQPGELAEVARLAGYLPLALRLVAARLGVDKWSVGKLIGRLADERKRLAVLQAEDLAVVPSFTLSYEQLSDGERRLFRRMHVSSEVSTELAATLLATDGDIAALEARRTERAKRIEAEAQRLAAARRPDGPRDVEHLLAAELRCPDTDVIRQAIRDAVGADAEIAPVDGGLTVRAAVTGRDALEVFRRLAVPAGKAAPAMKIVALVRDPGGELTDFDDFTLRLGSVFPARRDDWDPVLEQARADAKEALAAELPRPYLDRDEAEELLGRLADQQLVQPVSDDNYRFHDLLRVFARDVFDRDDEATPEWILDRRGRASAESYVKKAHDFRAAVAQAGGVTSSPGEVARRYLRICEIAGRLGVREWTQDWRATRASSGDPEGLP